MFLNYEELSKNDWELHKQLIAEGHNPNELANVIRNDEIEKLQEISSQNDFDFNQYVEPSLYERCDFINLYNVKLIDYAAFFGSIKCFKYLLINGAKVENTGKYAIAGGNEEIIHLCEQNHSSFEDAYETAIKYHKNDIFKYIYKNKFEGNQKDHALSSDDEINRRRILNNYLLMICVCNSNYELLSFLNKEVDQIDTHIINKAAEIGNLILVKHFLQYNQMPDDILVYSSQSKNIGLVKYILEQGKIDINTKDN